MTTTAEAGESDEALAPPPKRRPRPRVQMNVRIDAEDDSDLRAYEEKHGASRQAVVDQMIREYLQRRGLRD